jgi:hypothetical protein
MAIPSGFKRVNWLTLVANRLLTSIGGIGSLTNELGPNIVVDPLPGGVLLIAGAAPTLGDVNRQDDLRPYREVGTVLSKLRSRDHPPFLLNSSKIPDEEITEEWLAYFDR